MTLSSTGYSGSEMGMSESEVDSRNSTVNASQVTGFTANLIHCCLNHLYQGSEMGHSEAHVDNLHAEVQIIRCENGEWIWKNGICENCPKKAQLMQSLDLFHGEESVSKR